MALLLAQRRRKADVNFAGGLLSEANVVGKGGAFGYWTVYYSTLKKNRNRILKQGYFLRGHQARFWSTTRLWFTNLGYYILKCYDSYST